MRPALLLLITTSILAGAVASTRAQDRPAPQVTVDSQNSFRIQGTLTDQNGSAVSAAQVTIRDRNSNLVSESETGTDGRFDFTGVRSGTYRMSIVKPGFAPFDRDIVIGAADVTLAGITLSVEQLSENVTVTATRSAESIASVPGSVTIVEEEQLRNQVDTANSLVDALGKLVPGLAPGSESISTYGQTLRGRNALVLIDGVPQSTTRNITRDLATIDPSAIERVEVIRGTTSIYGEGATGGIISITTKRPTEGKLSFTTDVGGSSSISHPSGSLGGHARQTVTGKRGKFDFFANGAFDRTGGFFDADGDRLPPDPHGQGGLADTNAFNFLGKVGFDIPRLQRLQVTANRYYAVQDTEYASDPAANALPALSAKARAIAGLHLDENQDTGNSLLNLEYVHQNFLGSRLQGQVYHRDYMARFFPFDGRAFPVFGRTIYQSRLEQKKTGGRFAAETPLSQRRTGLTAVYGIDHVDERTSQPVGIMDPVAFDQSGGLTFRKIRDSVFVPLIHQKNTGLFAQFAWKKYDRLVLRGGLRHERIRVDIDDFTTIAGNSIRGGRLEYDDTLFNFGGVFHTSGVLNFFGNFGQGFSVPDIGLVLRGSPAGATVNTLPFAAQKVNTYETGARAAWQRVQTSLAVFYNTSDLGASSGGFNQPVIRAPEKVYGLEAVVDVQPLDRLRVGGTWTWLEGESDPNLDDIYTYLNSYRIPPMKLTGYIEHDTTANWFNRLQVTFSGERKRFGNNTGFGLRPVDDYATVDYLSTLRLARGVLRLGVENILNKQYFTRESQLLRTGFNGSYTAAQGAVLTLGYTISY